MCLPQDRLELHQEQCPRQGNADGQHSSALRTLGFRRRGDARASLSRVEMREHELVLESWPVSLSPGGGVSGGRQESSRGAAKVEVLPMGFYLRLQTLKTR